MSNLMITYSDCNTHPLEKYNTPKNINSSYDLEYKCPYSLAPEPDGHLPHFDNIGLTTELVCLYAVELPVLSGNGKVCHTPTGV